MAKRLERGERLRAIYYANGHRTHLADPSESVEEFRSITRALDVFADRMQNRRSLFYAAGKFGPPEPRHWPDGDETGFMDVWITSVQEQKGERPDVPDEVWQRWTWADGRVQRENYHENY